MVLRGLSTLQEHCLVVAGNHKQVGVDDLDLALLGPGLYPHEDMGHADLIIGAASFSEEGVGFDGGEYHICDF